MFRGALGVSELGVAGAGTAALSRVREWPRLANERVGATVPAPTRIAERYWVVRGNRIAQRRPRAVYPWVAHGAAQASYEPEARASESPRPMHSLALRAGMGRVRHPFVNRSKAGAGSFRTGIPRSDRPP